jgi:hypothetical protein
VSRSRDGGGRIRGEGVEDLLRRAEADSDVLGVVLTGSHALGLATPSSDYDVRLILRDEADEGAEARYLEAAFPNVDLHVLPRREFANYAGWDTPFAWERFSFAHAQVLVDRTGEVSDIVAEKGRIPPEQQTPFERAALDAFINSVYRALKCRRKGNTLCTRLEATEAVQHGLALIFACEGRIRPYPVALTQEIHVFPLATFPLTGDNLLHPIAAIVERGDIPALRHLFTAILDQALARGHADVIDSWGGDIAWMHTAFKAN